MSYANVVSAADAEIIENRKRAVRALLNDPGDRCFSSLFNDFKGLLGDDPVVKVYRCAVGVLVTEFFGVKSDAELTEYMRANASFDPYAAVAAKLGVENVPVEYQDDDETAPVSIRAIWRKNDHEECSFKQIGTWLIGMWDLDI